MITLNKMNAVGIVVRDLEKSLRWYKAKFGFEKLYDVSNGMVIGVNGVEIWIAQVSNPKAAETPDTAEDICIRLIGFEVSEEDLAKVKAEFLEDKEIVEIDHPKYKSYIIEDPDGHAIELYVDKY